MPEHPPPYRLDFGIECLYTTAGKLKKLGHGVYPRSFTRDASIRIVYTGADGFEYGGTTPAA